MNQQEQLESAFVYPIFKKWKTANYVLKFTSLTTGVVIKTEGGCGSRVLGQYVEDSLPHTDELWEDYELPPASNSTKTVSMWMFFTPHLHPYESKVLRTREEALRYANYMGFSRMVKIGHDYEVEV